jgi:hypothetical protein
MKARIITIGSEQHHEGKVRRVSGITRHPAGDYVRFEPTDDPTDARGATAATLTKAKRVAG